MRWMFRGYHDSTDWLSYANDSWIGLAIADNECRWFVPFWFLRYQLLICIALVSSDSDDDYLLMLVCFFYAERI